MHWNWGRGMAMVRFGWVLLTEQVLEMGELAGTGDIMVDGQSKFSVHTSWLYMEAVHVHADKCQCRPKT
jgi:hypothetical protein